MFSPVFRLLSVPLCVLQLCASCGSEPAPEAATAGESEPAESAISDPAAGLARDAAPDPDATLVVATRRAPRRLDPMGPLEPWGARLVDDLVFQGLTRRTPDHAPWAEPDLADHCEVDDEAAPRVVWCHLRRGAQFHDRSVITGDDVAYTFASWMDVRRSGLRAQHGLQGLRGAELVNAPPGAEASRDPGRWVKVTFEAPEPLALEKLASIKVIPKAAHRGRALAFGRAPVGSGPMRVASLTPDRVVLERASASGNPRRPGVARVVIRAVPDGAEALGLLRRGEVHILSDVAPVHVPDELTRPGMAPRFRAFLRSPPRYDLVVYNLRRGVWSGPRMRSALDDAVPRAAVAHELHGGHALPALAPVDVHAPAEIDLAALTRQGPSLRPGAPGLPAVPDPVQDVERRDRAGGILDALDWKLARGVRQRATGTLRITLMWDGSGGDAAAVAAALRDSWQDLGIQVPFSTAAWSYLRQGPLGRGEFDVSLLRLATSSDEDLHRYFHSKGTLNITGVSDRALDAALDEYRAARDRSGRDRAKTVVAEQIADSQAVSVVHAPAAVLLVSRRITGLTFVDDLPRLDTLGVLGGPDPWLLE